jgi:molybdopterin molybdotransferase
VYALEELFKLTSIAQAKASILNHWHVTRAKERVSLAKALDRELAEHLMAPEDVPGFTRSTVDGYAVKASDTYGATEALPAYLRITGQIMMGQKPMGELQQGQAMAIPTGGMLPDGADAVVMVEYTEEFGSHEVAVNRPVSPGENLIRRGEDVQAGTLVFAANHRLRPQDLGLLSSLGILEVEVFKPYRVGIISTGNEVVPPGELPSPGQVRDINSYTLLGLVKKSGAEPVLYGIVRDNLTELAEKIDRAVRENDLVLLSGGSSVGTRDFTVEALSRLGEPGLLLHGIPVKPGKPTVVAAADGKLIFGLPGHPVSAMVVYGLLVHPLLYYGSYDSSIVPVVHARLARNLASATGRQDHIRVKLLQKEGELWAEPVLGKSGLISTLVRADGELIIPADREGLVTGETVEVRLL